jgi:RNA polymerase sigma factor (sigma-70 family)
MGHNHMLDAFQRLRQMVRPEAGAGLGDAELLRRWVAHRDEAAFEVLLWRHGPMVLGVCRRVLRDAHAAEDALQATFLALARKAGSIGRREAVAGWLYRVAYRASLQARGRALPALPEDADALPSPAAGPDEALVWRDLRPVLDEEIGRLPARYRVPFVLRHLEGRTNGEVARELGCPLGTVLSRLARARERLRARLTRRGLTLSAGALTAGLVGEALAAPVPPGIVGALARAAPLVAAGRAPAAGLVSANAALLAGGVLKNMAVNKLKVLLAVVLALGLLGTGTAVLARRPNSGPQPAPGPQAREQPPPAAEAPPPVGEQPDTPDKAEDVGRAKEAERLAKERAELLDQALRRLNDARQKYREVEERIAKQLLQGRLDLIREEEQLRRLEREQAAERDHEQQAYRNTQAALLQPLPPDATKIREKLRELEEESKKREAERTERLIDARQKLARTEESLRRVEREHAFEREFAEDALRAAAQRVRRLEESTLPADAHSGSLADLERKVDAILREVGELRRAVEKQKKGPTPDR